MKKILPQMLLFCIFINQLAFAQSTTPPIQWQKAYGGTKNDGVFSIKQTADGYIMTGYTGRSDGDVSGNHGGADGWVFKTDNWGVIQWKKCIGGTKDEVFDAVQTTTDGGFILCGRVVNSLH
ncbi:hypothetical protein [Limnovirga soli]|uniref:Uncharacterized protein n=1 Tax=Limnovirga soli TaxID=2656915 RepID=A0A8J8FFM9_9BACT|nr:hypothetical protein [Limnovirga soli]NNV55484.1 hypothetical protein [Limnovirga soli]